VIFVPCAAVPGYYLLALLGCHIPTLRVTRADNAAA
jgi:hypothetical protein